jgi:thiosulfate/3-mercaptopyruvate sulfurtransferase
MRKLIALCVVVLTNLLGWDALQTTAQVASQLNDPKAVIIDVSESDMYLLDGHIHGAYHTDIGEWRSEYLLKTSDKLQKNIHSLGINTDSNVILYGHLRAANNLLTVSYVYWALKHSGVKNVAIMDGGLEQWRAEKRFVSNDDVTVPEGNFTVQIIHETVADREYVKLNLGKIAMLDARASENYFGITPSNRVERLGHIPGAASYFWTNSITPELKVKSADVLKKVFSDGFGLKQNQEILTYCTIGLEVTFNYFVLSGMLGYTNVRVYDASMHEWGNLKDTPMVQYKWEEFHPMIEVIK